MLSLFSRFWSEDSGQGLTEYALILALIFLAMVGAVGTFATTTIEMWSNVSNEVSGA